MELSSTFEFQGWDIKYGLTDSKHDSKSGRTRSQRIVFVHGTPWSSVVFQPIVRALLARGTYQILMYDLPGYGLSQNFHGASATVNSNEGFQGDTSVKFQAHALTELLKHVQMNDGASPPAVIAHDIAGTIVLRAHLIHAVEFESMMLLETNTVLPWGDGFYKLARSEPQAFLNLPPKIFEAVVRAVIQSACHNTKVLQTGWEDALARPWIGDLANTEEVAERQQSFVRQIAQANDADVAEMLEGNLYARTRCDVKIVWGEQDQWIPKSKIEDLKHRLGVRAKECVYVPEAGHLIMLDQPERFAIEVFDWLSRSGSN